MTLRVLCLDIEGGYGGSSRSLYESIRCLPVGAAAVEVWCRRAGPIQERYEAINVPCRVMPTMPHISSLPRLSRNLYVFGRFALSWRKSADFRSALEEAVRRDFDVIHFNHEGLFLLARWLRRKVGSSCVLVMHIRTHLPSTIFSRWQYRIIWQTVNSSIYITEMEMENVAMLSGRRTDGQVIYNIVAPPQAVEPDKAIAGFTEFKIASVSNYAWLRGNDRLVDIAVELKKRGLTKFRFIVAGNMKLSGSLPGMLGEIAQAGGTLLDYAERRGVGNQFHFVGSVPEPGAIFSACDVLMRPSRNNDPWGREILEAMSFGLPVITAGEYDKFVENGVTGFLHPQFDVSAFADDLVALSERQELHSEMSTACRNRIAGLCGGSSRSAELLQVWRDLSGKV